MTTVHVSGKVLHGLPNSLGFGVGSGVANAAIKISDKDPNPAPDGAPGGFAPGTSMDDVILMSTTNSKGEFSAQTLQWDSVKQVIVTPAIPAHTVNTLEPDGNSVHGVWVPNGRFRTVTHTVPGVPATLATYPDLLVLTGTVTSGSAVEQPLPPPLPTQPGNLIAWAFPPLAIPVKAPEGFLLPADDTDPARPARRHARVSAYRWARDIAALPWLAHCAEVPGTAPAGSALSAAVNYFGGPNALHSLPVPSEIPAPGYLVARGAHVKHVRDNEAEVRRNDSAAPADLMTYYQNAYPLITPLPESVGFGHSDETFVMQRLAGANPMMIERVTAIPSGFHVTDAHLREALGHQTIRLSDAIANQQLYMLDYKILAGLPGDPTGRRFLPAPFALFCLKDDKLAFGGKRLVPVAIQVERVGTTPLNPQLDPGPEVFTPSGGAWWDLAKLMVQAADLSAHELKSHLFETHICMEPFAVAAFREFDARHPIAQLLAENFRDMIFQMYAGRAVLINAGGGVDKLVGTGLAASLQIIDRARQTWGFRQAGLKADLARRGLLDPATSIPDYPYRDDALLLLEKIEAYVSSFVNHYYVNDAAVVGDAELQAWRNSASDPNQGNLPGIPAIQNRATLVQVVSQIIFTCTVQHAAVNFPQFDFIAPPTNMPAALYRTLPRRERVLDAGVDPRHPGRTFSWGHASPSPALDGFLPPKDEAIQQVSLAVQLGSFRSGKLGLYATSRFGLFGGYQLKTDQFASGLADQFQIALNDAETTIQRRNTGSAQPHEPRRLTYNFLLPTLIPNSLNI